MAARQPFLARRMGSPAPAPTPTPRPSRPSRPTPRRRPGRPPARPTPRRPAGPAPRPAPRPAPAPRPQLPRPLRPTPLPRVPRPLVPGPSPLGRGVARKLLRGLAPRLVPGLGWALLAWDAYELYQWWTQEREDYSLAAGGWHKCCSIPTTEEINARNGPFSVSAGTAPFPNCQGIGLCGTIGQVPSGPWPGDIPSFGPFTTGSSYRSQALYIGFLNPAGTRMTYVEGYKRTVKRQGVVNPDVPTEWPSLPVIVHWPTPPTELPYPYPYSEPPPIVRRRPEPEPAPEPAPAPEVPPGGQPGVGWSPTDPGGMPVPVIHPIQPPPPGDVEKKKRIKPGVSPAWWGFLARTGGSFMEVDDYVSAIYRALPWKLRRWRGRDGVWRDRAANTADRLKVLYDNLGELSIQDAVINLIKNEGNDRAWGYVGNKLKTRARELGDAGLWSGLRGPGAGTPLNKDQWDAQKARTQEEWRQRIARGEYHNWYSTRSYNPQTNRWERQMHQRPVTAIPWYRQESHYPRRVPLTGADGAYTVERPRYYYAERPSRRAISRRRLT